MTLYKVTISKVKNVTSKEAVELQYNVAGGMKLHIFKAKDHPIFCKYGLSKKDFFYYD